MKKVKIISFVLAATMLPYYLKTHRHNNMLKNTALKLK